VEPGRNEITEGDEKEIRNAVKIAKTHRTDVAADLFDFIGDVLTLGSRGEVETECLLRFQQFTSPVMAKGVEDTAFYCFNRMIGLNEVGGSPSRDGVSLDEFHAWCAKMQAEHPKTMNTLSTHDTKRSDDVRARLAVLTEIPGRWRAALQRWSRRNRQFKTGEFPDRNTEYLLYQTLVGAWPIDVGRVTAYMEKAVREAKQQTSWTQQNKEFEDALKMFIERILNSQEFIAEMESFVAQLLLPGRINSLAQTLIKCAAPGVPDTYQGGELWDLRLVDPDNRGPIDYAIREAMLAELDASLSVDEIMKMMDSGMPKLWVIYKALHLRRDHPEWFGESSAYTPLPVEGSKQAHLVAFSRGDSVAVLAPRWNLRLGSGFGATTVDLPAGRWANILSGEELTGGKIRAQNLFRQFPVSLLVRDAGASDASI
jgi:(1->4)-alpha-D-glucan 1-alpha-D-glucosylmutase